MLPPDAFLSKCMRIISQNSFIVAKDAGVRWHFLNSSCKKLKKIKPTARKPRRIKFITYCWSLCTHITPVASGTWHSRITNRSVSTGLSISSRITLHNEMKHENIFNRQALNIYKSSISQSCSFDCSTVIKST